MTYDDAADYVERVVLPRYRPGTSAAAAVAATVAYLRAPASLEEDDPPQPCTACGGRYTYGSINACEWCRGMGVA